MNIFAKIKSFFIKPKPVVHDPDDLEDESIIPNVKIVNTPIVDQVEIPITTKVEISNDPTPLIESPKTVEPVLDQTPVDKVNNIIPVVDQIETSFIEFNETITNVDNNILAEDPEKTIINKSKQMLLMF